MRELTGLLAGLAFLLVWPALSRAGDWPGWRGPTGLSVTDERDLPLSWDGKAGTHVLWKAPLRGEGQSSPIAWGDRVAVASVHWPAEVTQRERTPPEHHVTCYRAGDGSQLWDTPVPPGPWVLKDLRGGYGAPTPATDGERIYVLFGSAVLAALDLDGKIVWRKDLPQPYHFDVAIATSPVLYGDTVLLLCDQTQKSCLRAFDKKTGALQWERERPTAGFNHSTPALVSVEGTTQLVVCASNAVQGLNPNTGEVLWWCSGAGDVASPAYGSGIVYGDSGRGGPGLAVDATGKGDVTMTHIKWKIRQVPEGFASPLIAGAYVYRLHNPGVLRCWKLATGEEVYSERLEGVSTRSSPFVTPEGRIYIAGAGKSYVVKVGPRFEVLGSGDLGDGSDASAAVAGGRIFLKGQRYLWCVGKK